MFGIPSTLYIAWLCRAIRALFIETQWDIYNPSFILVSIPIWPMRAHVCYQWELIYVTNESSCMLPMRAHVCYQWEHMYVTNESSCMLPMRAHVCYQWELMYITNKSSCMLPMRAHVCYQWELTYITNKSSCMLQMRNFNLALQIIVGFCFYIFVLYYRTANIMIEEYGL